MGDKIPGWMYAAVVLGLLQLAEWLYNRFGFKTAGEIFAIGAILVAFIWMGYSGVKRFRKSRT